ncbi:hypothetical protein AMTR_s00156p00083980 [Amborella trichopoda]|uniref:Uncharacterized protein n=1 Tax=Amborella trichopoda TaxID=13333 RepID=W1PKP8_AMBTC|nr:hypothetical protein AMTR_s00156p00083980 [Amborella trichopoda]
MAKLASLCAGPNLKRHSHLPCPLGQLGPPNITCFRGWSVIQEYVVDVGLGGTPRGMEGKAEKGDCGTAWSKGRGWATSMAEMKENIIEGEVGSNNVRIKR